MEITVQSSKVVRPAYGGLSTPPPTAVVQLTVFDLVSFDDYMFGIHAFHPPAPSNAVLEAGLARALAEFREWAGRLTVVDSACGRRRAILLNDAGIRFLEATAGAPLGMPLLQPTPEVRRLHPSGGGEELMQVQVTRFACGSLVVGHAMHHAVGDGFAISQFLVAWGQATRGAVAFDPAPVHDRASFFVPRDPLRVEFQHRGAEFIKAPRWDEEEEKNPRGNGDGDGAAGEVVVVQQVRFSREFISELKSRAAAASAAGAPPLRRPYSTTQCLVAHLWRCITAARGLGGGDEPTRLHVAVNGRARMSSPRLPLGYTGNAVLWAHPGTTARELLAGTLGDAADLIRREVDRVDDAYFRSFIDFASSGAVEEEGLTPAVADPEAAVMSPDVAVYCLLRVPFYDIDFGGGRQFLYTPGYYPAEGVVYVLPPSPEGDGSVEAHVSLFSGAMDNFKSCCFSIDGALPSKYLFS